MLRFLSTLMLALVLVDSTCAVVNAAERPTSWTFGLGPRYTYVMNQETDESSHMGGIFARARSTYLGIEGAIDYHNEDLGLGVDLKSWPISATILVYPVSIVYALAGLGWYNTTLDFPSESPFEDQSDSNLGYHVGGGVEIPLSPRFSLTSDLRWLFVDYEFEEIADSVGDAEANSITLNAGLLIGLN